MQIIDLKCWRCGVGNVHMPGLKFDSRCGACGSALEGQNVAAMIVRDCAEGVVFEVAGEVGEFLGFDRFLDLDWGLFRSLKFGNKFRVGLGAEVKIARGPLPEEKISQIPIVASPEVVSQDVEQINPEVRAPAAPEEEAVEQIEDVIEEAPPASMFIGGQPPVGAPPPRVEAKLGPNGDTYEIAGWGYPIKTIEEMLSGGPSPAGFHSISDYLSCPERARLRSLGVRRRSAEGGWMPGTPLDPALGMGTLIHEMLAIRAVWGMGPILDLLNAPNGAGICLPWPLSEADRLKAYHLIMTYDHTHPLAADRYLGVEIEVRTNIGTHEKPIIRTVRYDKLFWADPMNGGRPELFSLEHKTSSRGGSSAMAGYGAQFATQVALWNANPHLVAKYGKMAGVIPDVLVKTAVPNCERYAPRYITPTQQKRALVYLRYAEQIVYPVDPEDGSYPRMLHACWDRFRPCEFIGLCHEDLSGDYNFEVDAEEAA